MDALCEFKGAKEQIVPKFLFLMQDSDINVWLGAAFGLEKLLDQDEKKTVYVPALVKSLSNPNEAIRENAKMFLAPQAAENAGIK